MTTVTKIICLHVFMLSCRNKTKSSVCKSLSMHSKTQISCSSLTRSFSTQTTDKRTWEYTHNTFKLGKQMQSYTAKKIKIKASITYRGHRRASDVITCQDSPRFPLTTQPSPINLTVPWGSEADRSSLSCLAPMEQAQLLSGSAPHCQLHQGLTFEQEGEVHASYHCTGLTG